MKYKGMGILVAGLGLGLGIGSGALAAGNPDKGSRVFQEECSDCHSATAGKNKKGPTLAGVIGRKAGSVPDFAYSDGMKSSGITWTADTIDPYLTHPKKVVPSSKMKYDGLDDPQAREDVIAYLLILR